MSKFESTKANSDDSIVQKLHFKGQREIYVLDHPREFEEELNVMKDFSTVKTRTGNNDQIEFILTFVRTQEEIENVLNMLTTHAKGDAIVWFAYPKGTSKKYRSEINRDKGWQGLGQIGFEAVRNVSIDDDWTALRFRKVEFIKTMNRRPGFAMTGEGQRKTRQSDR